MATRKFSKELKAEWLEELRKDLKPGDTLHTIVRNRAASGMSRHIDVYRFTCEGGQVVKHWLSPRVAAVCGFTFDDNKECMRISGCGMDMCHHVVYSLGRKLFPEGFGVACSECGQRPKNREDAEDAIATFKRTSCSAKHPFIHKYYGRNRSTSGWDNDGGYALKSEQI